MKTSTFLQTHRVFHLAEATRILAPAGGKAGTQERLKYYARQGQVKKVAREVYATVPPQVDSARFRPDLYLVAEALRPDAVFSHHAALELLGAAHSEWQQCSVFVRDRRSPLRLGGAEVRFLSQPAPLVREGAVLLGTRRVRHLETELQVTGPERTLVEGFRQPGLVGGLEELVVSASGFPVLDLELLFEVLGAYGEKGLWAAVGWFLERYREQFFIRDTDLLSMERHLPKAVQYLRKGQRGGRLLRRWRLVVPEDLLASGEPDEP
jgi:hypothetical protein